jgi:hypothetical protein
MWFWSIVATKDLNPQRTWNRPRMSIVVQILFLKEIVAITMSSKNLNPWRRPRTSKKLFQKKKKKKNNGKIM